jgi:hypothetical protein
VNVAAATQRPRPMTLSTTDNTTDTSSIVVSGM